MARTRKKLAVNDRGFALATVILALVVIGAIAAGGAFVATQEQRAGDSSRRLAQAFGIAEGTGAELMTAWDAQSYSSRNNYPNDSVLISTTNSAQGTGVYGASIFKLNPQIYFLDITGTDTRSRTWRDGGARQRVGMLVRVVPLQLDMKAALTVGGPVVFGGGNVFVKGQDTPPAGWSGCPPADTTLGGVRAKNAGDVSNSQGQVTGSPAVIVDPTMDSTTFINYGSTNYNKLAAQADVTLPPATYTPTPSVTAGVCQTAVTTNWGDGNTPANPCGRLWKIVHVTGNLTLGNGQGQGVLLVDGDLNMTGNFNFYGLIVVRGAFKTSGAGVSRVYGNLMAQSIDLAQTAFMGDAVINYSKCAIERAMEGSASPSFARSRGWVELL